MSYLSFLIALFQLLGQGGTEGLTFYQGLDKYLDMVVGIEWFFVKLSLVGLAIAAIIFVVTLLMGDDLGWSCGCYLLVLGVAWPVLEVITFFISRGLASSVSPEAITNPTKFWLLVVLMALLGAG